GEFLIVGDTSCGLAWARVGPWASGSVRRNHGGVLHAGAHERRAVQARALEAAPSLRMTTTHHPASVPLPPPVARPQDGPLRQDVRWLAATLGRVVGRLAGEDTFRAVEELRRACRARRLGVAG